MGKEIIHIEVDEDIAGIIGRVMAAKEKVVAVVAPKNLGALRSAMNLKLLKKAAKNADKVVAVISDNPAMVNLAGVAGVPLAKNLESKPVVPEVEHLADGQLVAEELTAGEALTIDGSDMSLTNRSQDSQERPGDLASPLASGDSPSTARYGSDSSASESLSEADSSESGVATSEKKRKFNALTAKVDKVWQKVLIIGGVVLGALVIGVVAMVIAIKPSATVNVATHMDTIDVRNEVQFKVGDNNVGGGLFQLTEKSLGVEQDEEFEATGEKEEGTKASGTVTVRYCGPSAMTVSEANSFEANGKRYRVSTRTELPAASCAGAPESWNATTVAVVADDIGEDFNVASGVVMSFSADPNGHSTRVTSGGISGGSKRTVRVVSEEDVKNALNRLDSASIEEGRARLKASLDDDLYAFDQTFVATSGSVEVTPRVGEPIGNGDRATVKRTQNYRIMTASKSDMERFAMELAESQAAGKQIYEIGDFAAGNLFLERVEITAQTGGTTCGDDAPSDCVPTPGTVREIRALLKTVARAGDSISVEEIAEVIANQRVADANRLVMEFRGVQRVEVTLRPFWANRLPKDVSRITINIQADS
ncbi:hypothetical protein FWG76_00555 [Candidatus Saccharibacteria bacterium]|nr:hypothetical protein [Candidatus Saccharibacteria bacterium]